MSIQQPSSRCARTSKLIAIDDPTPCTAPSRPTLPRKVDHSIDSLLESNAVPELYEFFGSAVKRSPGRWWKIEGKYLVPHVTPERHINVNYRVVSLLVVSRQACSTDRAFCWFAIHDRSRGSICSRYRRWRRAIVMRRWLCDRHEWTRSCTLESNILNVVNVARVERYVASDAGS